MVWEAVVINLLLGLVQCTVATFDKRVVVLEQRAQFRVPGNPPGVPRKGINAPDLTLIVHRPIFVADISADLSLLEIPSTREPVVALECLHKLTGLPCFWLEHFSSEKDTRFLSFTV